jgi:ABC-type Fe3+-siderophore transport system permease subunit
MTTASRQGTRPTAVTVSFVLCLLTVMAKLIGGLAFLVGWAKGANAAAVFASIAGFTAHAPKDLAWVSGLVVIAFAIAVLIVSVQMARGRNWARIVLALVALAEVCAAFTVGGWAVWTECAVVVLATILAFQARSNPWFERAVRRA